MGLYITANPTNIANANPNPPTPADRVVPVHVWADFVSVSGSVLSQRQEQQQLLLQSVRCAVQNSKLWVCMIGSVSVFLLL